MARWRWRKPRRRARDMLTRIRAGGNPADDIQREKHTPTFRAFADEYQRRCGPHWKPSGRKTVRNYLTSRILPAFGKLALDRIGPEDVAAWFDAGSRDSPGAANRAFEILRAMMFRAEEWGARERGTNPCLGIAKNPRNHVARFLDTDELARLGRALDACEAQWPETVAAIRLLALTGCPPQRSAQSALARYRGRRHQPARFQDRPARVAARRGRAGAHRGASRRARPRRLPVPAFAHGKGYYPFCECWRTVCADARLRNLRLHDLRHTAASQAVMSGENLPLVGKLLGHRRHRTTAGYAHLADAHLVEAVEKVGAVIAAAMGIPVERRATPQH